MFKRFEPNSLRTVPKSPTGPTQHDIATDSRQTGTAIENMTERALAQIRRTPVQAAPAPVEISEGEAIEAMTRAAMPNVVRDARALQISRRENAKAQPRNLLAVALAQIGF